MAAPGTFLAAIFSLSARAATLSFSAFFFSRSEAAAAISSSSRSFGGSGGGLAHIPRCLRGTVLPPRILRPSSVFWDIRLLCFLAALRCAKSTPMAVNRKSAAAAVGAGRCGETRGGFWWNLTRLPGCVGRFEDVLETREVSDR